MSVNNDIVCGLKIRGVGAVTAAGWSYRDFVEAILNRTEIPPTLCERTKSERQWSCHVRRVPAEPSGRVPKSPRLRRASQISRFAMGAAIEALQQAGYADGQAPPNLGIIFCAMNGCVNFTSRFYQEVLDDPKLASPIFFPETVFNAPASHLAHYLGADGPVSTLIGEPTNIVEALCMASSWIRTELVTECLIIGAEECDWLSAEAATYYHRDLVASEGAAALLLSASGDGSHFQIVQGPFSYHSRTERGRQLSQMTASLSEMIPSMDASRTVLIDDSAGIAVLDRQESNAWSPHWSGPILSPKRCLGETMGAAGALQLVLGAAIARQEKQSAIISMPGYNAAAYSCIVSP